MYAYIFFASFKSMQGLIFFQMFAFKNSKFYRLNLMHKEASAPEEYEDCIIKGRLVISVSFDFIGLNLFGSITHNCIFLKIK